jgi:hypothetical protein
MIFVTFVAFTIRTGFPATHFGTLFLEDRFA